MSDLREVRCEQKDGGIWEHGLCPVCAEKVDGCDAALAAIRRLVSPAASGRDFTEDERNDIAAWCEGYDGCEHEWVSSASVGPGASTFCHKCGRDRAALGGPQ